LDQIIIEKNGEEIRLETKVIEKTSDLKPLLNEDCFKIFKLLQEKASFPAEIAKEIGLNEQKVYYHIKQLKNKGLIELEKTEERNGALAKYYKTEFDSFSIVPTPELAGKKHRVLKEKAVKSDAEEFLNEFTRKGIFSAKIVVGSPDPHGKFKARARDGHLAAELTAFLGANTRGFEMPLIFLDTMVKDLNKENSNLIILGGPITNKLAKQANDFLPIKFNFGNGNWALKSEPSKKEYAEDSIGVIEKIPHPYFKGKHIILIAGKRNSGTIAAILALAKKTRETVKPNTYNKKVFARVIEGLDVDGDGMIDEVEFRE